jgi:hypothetical protein
MNYYTNFIKDENDKVIFAQDFDTLGESIKSAMDDRADGFKVERVGPLSNAPLWETPYFAEPDMPEQVEWT